MATIPSWTKDVTIKDSHFLFEDESESIARAQIGAAAKGDKGLTLPLSRIWTRIDVHARKAIVKRQHERTKIQAEQRVVIQDEYERTLDDYVESGDVPETDEELDALLDGDVPQFAPDGAETDALCINCGLLREEHGETAECDPDAVASFDSETEQAMREQASALLPTQQPAASLDVMPADVRGLFRFKATYRKAYYELQLTRSDAGDAIVFTEPSEFAGRAARSMGHAGKLVSGHGVDTLRFWQPTGHGYFAPTTFKVGVRKEKTASEPKPRTARAARVAPAFTRSPHNHVPEGKRRVFCVMCMASFLVDDDGSEPEQCENGHTAEQVRAALAGSAVS